MVPDSAGGLLRKLRPDTHLVNRVFTAGLRDRWRMEAVRECLAGRPRRILDPVCGTGELACLLALRGGSDVEVTALDGSAHHLERARRRAASRPACRVTFMQGPPHAMPFPPERFDVVGMDFSLRPLLDRSEYGQDCLKEAWRVLVPAGRLVILETSQPSLPALRGFYHLVLRSVLAPVGGWLTGHRDPYRQLARSAARFVPPAQVEQWLREAGFKQVSTRPLAMGMVAVHVAEK